MYLHEKSKEVYEKSKMKRLMITVRCMMEDTLYSLVTSSLQQYVEFLEDMCNFQVSIHLLTLPCTAMGCLMKKKFSLPTP